MSLPAFMPNLTVSPEPRLSLPEWRWQGVGGDCGPGGFVTDAASSLETAQVRISNLNLAGSDSSWMMAITGAATIVVFRDNQGRTAAFGLSSIAPVPGPMAPDCLLMQLSFPVGALNWKGEYSIQFQPAQ